jgi:TolB-like protein/tetratricopeptide (TPR) repeat protein
MSAAGNNAVFLSYASQDAEAARRICEALRAAGVEVWFDQSELVGGDAWDAKIRRQIKECALFVPIISANTNDRLEGYFRLEWLLAVERSRLMAEEKAFLFPIVIDATTDATARVPEKFRDVQWTRLGRGDGPQAREEATLRNFALRLHGVLQATAPTPDRGPEPFTPETAPAARPVAPSPRLRSWLVVSGLAAATALAVLWPRSTPKPAAKDPDVTTVAVLPFRARTVDIELADTLHDEVISALGRVRAIRVLSREAVNPYRDAAQRKHGTIAQQVGATAIVDVMVRLQGAQLLIESQLLDARTGSLEWTDILRSDIGSAEERASLSGLLAQKIAIALRVLPGEAEQAARSRPPTKNAEAYALYQRSRFTSSSSVGNRTSNEEKIQLLRAAIAKDPSFAAAHAQLVEAHAEMYWFASNDPSPERKSLAKEALDQAMRLVPDAPETQLARGIYLYRCERDYRRALESFQAAEQSLPGETNAKRWIGLSLRRLGRLKESLIAFEQSLLLEPRHRGMLEAIIETCFQFRRFDAVLEHGRRYNETGGKASVRYLARAAYELSGDKAQFEKEMFYQIEDSTTVGALRPRYGRALLREDFAEAARLLDDAQLWPALYITRINPSLRLDAAPSVHRAYLALARSDRAGAKAHAEDALKRLSHEIQTDEEGYIIRVAMAEMMAIAGQGDGAVIAMKKVIAEITRRDPFEGLKYQHRLACVFAAADMPREALDQLAMLMQQPCDAAPSELREEPMLVSLRALPEFERILTSAKKL